MRKIERDRRLEPILFPIDKDNQEIEVAVREEKYNKECFECMRSIWESLPRMQDFNYRDVLEKNGLIGERDKEILDRKRISRKQKDEEEKD